MLTGRLNLWAPYQDLRREVDRLFDSFTGGENGGGRGRAFPLINLWEEGDVLHLEAEMPGVAQSDLEISAAGNELTLRGRRNSPKSENRAFHRQERGFGEFTRVLTLPVEVDPERIEATLKDGVLTLALPKAAAARARKIQVKVE
jgi:HSP20 family protein